MPRQSRVVVPGIGHHVTQRGTGRQRVFYSRKDRLVYLGLLRDNCRKAGVRILAYCLLSNHIHAVLVPEEEDSLAVALRRAHGRYAQYFNARKVRSGHLWQNRFYSCPLGPGHLGVALGYVEMNPVRAGLVKQAGDYEWSSAMAHLGGKDPQRILDLEFWHSWGGAGQWRQMLAAAGDEASNRALVKATFAGNPFGTQEFRDEIRLWQEGTGRHVLPSDGAPMTMPTVSVLSAPAR